MNIMLQKGIVWDSKLTACHCKLKLKLKLNRAFSVNTLIVVEVKLLLQAR